MSLVEHLRECAKDNGYVLRDPPSPSREMWLMNQAADEIERLRGGLKSISKNTCCEGCQEAKLVALATLGDSKDPA